MYTDENQLLVRRYYEEVVNTGPVDALAEFLSPGYEEVYHHTRRRAGLRRIVEHGGAANGAVGFERGGVARAASTVRGLPSKADAS